MNCKHEMEIRTFVSVIDDVIVHQCSCGVYTFNSTYEGVVVEGSEGMTHRLLGVLDKVKKLEEKL